MDLEHEPVDPDEPEELAVTQVIARLGRVGAASAAHDPLDVASTGDELLDEFWRRRSATGHC
jgi:hypothetical protein